MLTRWLLRDVAAILNILISDSFVIDVFSIFYEIFLWPMLQILTDDKLILVQINTWCHQLILVLVMAWCHQLTLVNSFAPGTSECDSKDEIFNLVLLIGIFRSSHDNALRWMPQDLTDDKSALVQVMAWCHQATSHYLSQCWLSPLSPYGIARPQWVKVMVWYYLATNHFLSEPVSAKLSVNYYLMQCGITMDYLSWWYLVVTYCHQDLTS